MYRQNPEKEFTVYSVSLEVELLIYANYATFAVHLCTFQFPLRYLVHCSVHILERIQGSQIMKRGEDGVIVNTSVKAAKNLIAVPLRPGI